MLWKNNTCVIAIVIFYDDRTTNPEKFLMVFSCVLYYFMGNYFFIEYLCCQSKTISDISSDNFFENKSYNEFLSIGVPGVLMNLIS